MENKWFDKTKPLWMPEKSVRSIIALAFTGAAIIAMFALGAGVPEWFALLLGIIIRDYFAQGADRDAKGETDNG
jgi:hypothetical protein